MELLKSAAHASECAKLNALMTRCSEMGGKFTELVTEIKRASRWTEQALNETALKRVLNWTGCTKEEAEMDAAWEEFLNAYYEADQEALNSHDAALKASLRKFIRQSAILTSFMLAVPRNVTF